MTKKTVEIEIHGRYKRHIQDPPDTLSDSNWVKVRTEFYYACRRDINAAIVLSRVCDRAKEDFAGLQYKDKGPGAELNQFELWQKGCFERLTANKRYAAYAAAGGWIMFQSDYWLHKLGMQEGQLSDSLKRLEACGAVEVSRSQALGFGRGIRLVRVGDRFPELLARCFAPGRRECSWGSIEATVCFDFLTYATNGELVQIGDEGPLPKGLVPDVVDSARKAKATERKQIQKIKTIANPENADLEMCENSLDLPFGVRQSEKSRLANLENPDYIDQKIKTIANPENADLEMCENSLDLPFGVRQSEKSRLANLENPDYIDQKIQTSQSEKSRLANLENPDLRIKVLGLRSDDSEVMIEDVMQVRGSTATRRASTSALLRNFEHNSFDSGDTQQEHPGKKEATKLPGIDPEEKEVSAPRLSPSQAWELAKQKMKEFSLPSENLEPWYRIGYDTRTVGDAAQAGYVYAVRSSVFKTLVNHNPKSPIGRHVFTDANGNPDHKKIHAIVQTWHRIAGSHEGDPDVWAPVAKELHKKSPRYDSSEIQMALESFPEPDDPTWKRNYAHVLGLIETPAHPDYL